MTRSPRSLSVTLATLATTLLMPLVMQVSPPPGQELPASATATAMAGVSAGQV